MGGAAKRFEPWSRLPCGESVAAVRPAWRDEWIDFGAIRHTVLPFGRGRTFGDTCANPGGVVIDTERLDRFVAFDRTSGLLHCEAGTTIAQILDLAVPHGWFPPVCPGTKHVSVGGAIAHDVHGKNHHRTGTFGEHVIRLELLRSSGERLWCSRDEHPELFRATIGGLGLTGLILSAELQLHPAALRLDTETVRCTHLDEFFDFAERGAAEHDYHVTWVDSFAGDDPGARVLISRANPAPAGERTHAPHRFRLPASIPAPLFNRLSIRALNVAYYRAHVRRLTRRTVDYESFLFPQDALHPTNGLYGRRGVWAHQSLIPFPTARAAVPEILRRVSRPGDQSWGTVLKVFGARTAPGMLSFTGAGISVTVGFPNWGPRCLRALDDLDRIVVDAGGKLYPAKDARMPRDVFRRSFPDWEAFARHVDPQFSSRFWRRVSEAG